MIVPLRGVESHLPETAHVVTSTFTSDSGGGATRTTTSGTATPCRIDAMGGSEAQVAGRISDRSTHLVTLPAETAVTEGQDLTIDGVGSFEITAVRAHTDELCRVIEVVTSS